LYDLDAPVQVSLAGLNDSHTLTTGFVNVQSQGNPHLVPEVGETYTVGFVYRPNWIPRFSLALDYYDISLTNAITTVSGGTATYDQLCDASGGTSPYCSLYVRPFGFSNTSAANYPTTVLSQPLNIAKQWTHGIDIEANYNFKLEDVLKPLEGNVALRALANYQPILDSITVPGTQAINGAGYANGYTGVGAGSIWKLTFIGSYTDGPIAVNVQERWRSSQLPNVLEAASNTAHPLVYAANTTIPAVAYTDLTLTYNFKTGSADTAAFITVQNLFDQQPSPFVNNSANTINFYNDVTAGDDVIGRYITVGLRLKL
jgi:outer membrane receptor protein involved in Fe transport